MVRIVLPPKMCSLSIENNCGFGFLCCVKLFLFLSLKPGTRLFLKSELGIDPFIAFGAFDPSVGFAVFCKRSDDRGSCTGNCCKEISYDCDTWTGVRVTSSSSCRLHASNELSASLVSTKVPPVCSRGSKSAFAAEQSCKSSL